tara:strand:- start:2337 stop:2825 length:489 start_codon:yes stop_codon:yes gene_type:complete
MNAQKIIRHEWVELPVVAGSTLTRFNFPDLPNLRNVLLFGIKCYTTDMLNASINNQLPLLSHTNILQKSYITLVNYGGKEFLKQAPLQMFNTNSFNLQTSTNFFETYAKDFAGQRVNWPKSYIQLTSVAGNVTDQTYALSVFYSMPLAQERSEDNFSFANKG